jgi:error-prone DNA polymerase
MSTPPPFVELRTHSAFSFGDGSVTPEALVEAAVKLGYTHLGLTDIADFGGVARFACAAQEVGIQPIIGAELVVDGHPAALLARTPEGCRHLASLITHARAGTLREWDGRPERKADHVKRAVARRGRPEVRWADVVQCSAGLYALTGPPSGALAALLRRGDEEGAARMLGAWRDIFGPFLAVEVQLHNAGRSEAALAGALIALAERSGVPWVVTNDPRYLKRG